MQYPNWFIVVDQTIPENIMLSLTRICVSPNGVIGEEKIFNDLERLDLLCSIDRELMDAQTSGIAIFCGSHISKDLVSKLQNWHPRAYYLESEDLWDQIEYCRNIFDEMSVVRINISHALEAYADVSSMVENLAGETICEDKHYDYGLEHILSQSRSAAEDRAKQWVKDKLIMKALWSN